MRFSMRDYIMNAERDSGIGYRGAGTIHHKDTKAQSCLGLLVLCLRVFVVKLSRSLCTSINHDE